MADALSGQSATALSAARKAFSGRALSVLNTPTPAEALLDKKVRMAVVNTSAFFELGDDVFPVRREGMQAVGVIGYDTVHILTRDDSDIASINDAERIGVARAGGGSEHVARILLAGLGHTEADVIPAPGDVESPIDAQIDALRNGELNAVLFMAEIGHPRIVREMQTDDLRLIRLPEWQEGNNLIRFPFLRLTRINEDTYPNMTGPVDSIGAQVVLAGPVPAADPIGTAGPGSAAVGEVLPLTSKTVTALNEALPSRETIDPAIPVSPILAPRPKPEPEPINPSTAYSVVNFLAICLMVFFLYLYVRKQPVSVRRRQARKSGGA
ncbi:TAXI family TRAP transporter solute-binding subunit [Chelativorans xinjiangense]|uniref:TAXI family TRAP transporter solute-binding subunit n=1 Tax=Chelativorans xinjiangense TaxID=2681485 RepID=UPI0013569DC1|nr:TAXI family TRAP transporter solute-binding subunit [Chelativorans xinjiangense]